MTNGDYVLTLLDRLAATKQSLSDQELKTFLMRDDGKIDSERFASVMTLASMVLIGDPDMLDKTILKPMGRLIAGSDAIQ